MLVARAWPTANYFLFLAISHTAVLFAERKGAATILLLGAYTDRRFHAIAHYLTFLDLNGAFK